MSDSDSIDVLDAPAGAYREAVKVCQDIVDRRRVIREAITKLLSEYSALGAESQEAFQAMHEAQHALVVAAGPGVKYDDEAPYTIDRAERMLSKVGTA